MNRQDGRTPLTVKMTRQNDKAWAITINNIKAGQLEQTEDGRWRTALSRWQAYSNMRFDTFEKAKTWFGHTFECDVETITTG